ncbi:MAG: histidinol dehydrogenase [Desulfovibrio sp.]|jgi:hypothetical protein|nr:histidinol dehydrogenase [Desulfovibrio sp.]
MQAFAFLESRLEKRALPESASEAAYAGLGGKDKALLKKCIARLYRIFGESVVSETRTKSFREGFTLEIRESPAAFSLFVCESAYPSPPLCLAALLPALLSGAPLLFCFIPSPDKKEPDPALLVALELAGVEKSYLLAETELLAELDKMGPPAHPGRMLLLGRAEIFAKLALFAHKQALPCLSLPRTPFAGFIADEEHKDFALWPDLSPAWFRSRSARIACADSAGA